MPSIKSCAAYLNSMLDEEYHRLNLWYFVSFIAGIIFYFALPHEPSMRHVAAVFLSSFCTLWLRKYGVPGIFLSGMLIAFTYGIFVSKYRETGLGMTALRAPMSALVSGDVVSMKPTTRGVQIVLSNATCNKQVQFPKQIRLNLKTEHAKALMIGDTIKVFAFLNPPPRGILPGGYDFGLYAYFSGIGAVGYGLSEPKIIKKDGASASYGFNSALQDMRRRVYYRFIDVMGSDHGNFAASILLGENSGINQSINQDMRLSGISHLLGVSGLNLVLVAALFFIPTRALLNLSDTISFKCNVKMLAAIISLIGSFGYLLVSGMQVAAVRAFITTAIFIFAIMIGRLPYPLRSMGISAVIILSINPEYVIHPSFQLSFVAVLALIAGYEFYVRNQWIFGNSKGILASIKLHLLSNIYSSIVAGAATTPIVIYHFYISSNYSILANLIAVPIVSFLMMPLIILAVITMPFNLDYYVLKCLVYAIQIVIDTARYVAHIPGNIWYFGYITPLSLVLFMFGFFWVALWQKSWRYFGWIIIIISCVLMFLSKKPDVIFDPYLNALGVQNEQNEVEIYAKRIPKFTKNYWVNWFGQKDATWHNGDITRANQSVVTLAGKKIKVLYTDFDCDGDVILNAADDRRCVGTLTLTKSELLKHGTVLVFCTVNGCKLEYNDAERFRFE